MVTPRSGRKPARSSSNSAALEKTIRALARSGRLEAVDSAVMQAARSMARELDAHPGKAMLWREYQAAIERLRGPDTGGAELKLLFDELSSDVGNASKT